MDRCNPHRDFEQREQILLTLPDAAERRTREPEFEIGSYRTVHHLSSFSLDEWVLLQSFHDGARLLGNYGSSRNSDGTALAAAVRRIWVESPRLAISTGLRAGERGAWKALQNLLDRASVAALPQEKAGDLYRWLAEALRRAMAQSDGQASRTVRLRERLLYRAPEIVSRLMLRIADEHLNDAFELARTMHAHDFYQNSRQPEILANIWERLFMAASASHLRGWMLQIIKLDIPQLDTFPWNSRFPEPSDYFQETIDLVTDDERATWKQDINRLIHDVHSRSASVRERSCRRLAFLVDVNALDDEQRRRLADAMWGQIDDTGLPKHTSFLPHAFLALPDSEPGRAERVVRAYFVDPARMEVIRQDRTESFFYLKSILGATHVPWLANTERNPRIEWSAQEQARLVPQIVSVWLECKTKISDDELSSLWGLVRSALFGVLASGHAIRDVKTKDTIREALQKFQQDMSEPVIAMVEARLFDLLGLDTGFEASIAACAEDIRNALNGIASDQVVSASGAIYYWHVYAICARLIPEPPPDLLDELIGHAIRRRQPGLADVLSSLISIVRDAPTAINETHVKALQRTLRYMHQDLQPPASSQSQASQEYDRIGRHDQLEDHYRAVHLAVMLARLLQKRGKPVPKEIEAWRDVADNSPFPEVRRLWKKLQA